MIIQSLTSLRFVFALMIFMHHFTVEGNSIFPEGGALSVCFFFILSGFVLAYSYRDRIINNEITKKSFWIGRLSKLYPLHILCFLIAFILGVKSLSVFSFFTVPCNFLLLQSWLPCKEIYFSFNSVSWFSSDMLFFYLMFPLLIGKLCQMGWRKKGIWIISILILYFLLIALLPSDLYHPIFYINPLMRLLDFCLGILLFLLFDTTRKKANPNKWMATLFESCLISLFVGFVAFADGVPDVVKYAVYYWIPVSVLIYALIYINNGGGIFKNSIGEMVYFVR